MTSKKRASAAGFSLKALSAAVLSALVLSQANAAGLGRMTVLSGLGQPLRAEIELTSVAQDEVGALAAKLASVDAFRQANIDFNAALMSLRFNVQQRGDRQFIQVSSTQPLNEPFIDMLLELSGPNGRLIREYTFLLDPPDMRSTQAAPVAPEPVPQLGSPGMRSPAPTARAAQGLPAEQPRRVSPEPGSGRAQPATAAGMEAGAPAYQVRQGDTLMQIAGRTKPVGISLDQMLVALYQSNPDAFAEKNMNRLRAGQILDIPSAETAAAVDPAQARSLIVAQATDFNNYRNRLADQVATASARRAVDGGQGASGRITARVEERATPASESRDKLQLSNAAASGVLPAGSASPEDLIAAEKALAESNARVKELEKNISDLQKLLELKNQGLADQQKQAESVAVAPSAPAAAAPAVVSPVTTAESTSNISQPPVVTTPPAAPAAPAARVVAPPKPAEVPPPPGLVDELLANPLTLPGLGGLLILLGGLGIYRIRRQKKSKQFEDSIITDSSLKANSLFGSTGGQSVDTNNSVFNSGFAPSVSQLDSNEVDPVAEADVYIAYGRDAQAEEILKEALRTQPDRHAVRVKLLEIYSNRKDLRAFEVLATELYGLTKGTGEDWAEAAAMGVAIDANNPLYASAKTDKSETKQSDLIAPTQPLEEAGLATLLSATETDTASLETLSSLESDTAYFSNTAAPESELTEDPVLGSSAEHESPKHTPNDLDFDLEGMNLEMAVPNTIPRPTPAEPSSALASIDFDFLDTKAEPSQDDAEPQLDSVLASEGGLALDSDAPSVPESTAVMAQAPDLLPSLDDLEFELNEVAPRTEATSGSGADISLDMGALELESEQASFSGHELEQSLTTDLTPESQPESAEPSPLDFDLSAISLELDPAMEASSNLDDANSADNLGSSEMATKLDLAIAYQEIGDKEGARELLDEVLKGGSQEQSEKAKSLLLELA